jgi:hypothetical protein
MRRFLVVLILASLSFATPAAVWLTMVIAARMGDAALRQLDSAMRELAARPQFSTDIGELAARLGLTADRFRVSRTSLVIDGRIADGVSIQPKGKLDARAFVDKLGVAGATANSVNRAHRVWNVRVGKTTEIPWHGMTVQIWLDTEAGTLDTATVQFVTVVR